MQWLMSSGLPVLALCESVGFHGKNNGTVPFSIFCYWKSFLFQFQACCWTWHVLRCCRMGRVNSSTDKMWIKNKRCSEKTSPVNILYKGFIDPQVKSIGIPSSEPMAVGYVVSMPCYLTRQEHRFGEEDAEALAHRGWELLRKLRHHDAIADFTRAIELNQNHAAAYHRRGIVQEILGEDPAEDYQMADALLLHDPKMLHEMKEERKWKPVGWKARLEAKGERRASDADFLISFSTPDSAVNNKILHSLKEVHFEGQIRCLPVVIKTFSYPLMACLEVRGVKNQQPIV